MFGQFEKLVKTRTDMNLLLLEFILGLSYILIDLFFWLKNRVRQSFDSMEELG